jgi:hypothetical protein
MKKIFFVLGVFIVILSPLASIPETRPTILLPLAAGILLLYLSRKDSVVDKNWSNYKTGIPLALAGVSLVYLVGVFWVYFLN